MPRVPRLKIKSFGAAAEEICDLHQAGYFLDFEGRMVMVEGQRVGSYDELVRLASQDKYREQEFLEVILLPAIIGG
jgi:hypothetical protein